MLFFFTKMLHITYVWHRSTNNIHGKEIYPTSSTINLFLWCNVTCKTQLSIWDVTWCQLACSYWWSFKTNVNTWKLTSPYIPDMTFKVKPNTAHLLLLLKSYLGAGTVDLLSIMTKPQAEYLKNCNWFWIWMSETSPPLSYASNHEHQQYYFTSPVSLKTTYHSCVFTQCLTAILKYDTCSNATYLETLLGEETESAKSNLHGHWGRHTMDMQTNVSSVWRMPRLPLPLPQTLHNCSLSTTESMHVLWM
jgi:hypothetical protein